MSRYNKRKQVRNITRKAWIDSKGDPVLAKELANKETGSIIGLIILNVFIGLVSQWIIAFINDWANRGVSVPPETYQSIEPGYQSE